VEIIPRLALLSVHVDNIYLNELKIYRPFTHHQLSSESLHSATLYCELLTHFRLSWQCHVNSLFILLLRNLIIYYILEFPVKQKYICVADAGIPISKKHKSTPAECKRMS